MWGGWGDIAVATAALALLATTRPTSRIGWAAYSVWNVVGLIDLLFVVGTAARLALQAPDSMRVLLQLPLSLLPTWLVPLLISTHLLLGVRLWGMRAGRGN